MATNFVAVSINIMHDKNLTQTQKFILAEIEQLSQLDRGCIASNRHFSKLLGISKQGVSKAINELQNKGYICIDNSQTERNYGRIITINHSVPPINHSVPPINHSVPPINCSLQSKENKTINKTINKKINKKEKLLPDNLNVEAFNMWCEYKGSTYKQQGKTLSANLLAKHPQDKQMQMVENSIMNNYKGLFEIKETPKSNQTGTYDAVDAYFDAQHTDAVDVEVLG